MFDSLRREGGVIEKFNVRGSKGLSKKENFGEAERYSNLILELTLLKTIPS